MGWDKPRVIRRQQRLLELYSMGFSPENLSYLYYNEKKSIPEIRILFPTVDVYYWMKKWGIKRRSTSEGFLLTKTKQLEKQGITKELLSYLYIDKMMSVRSITEHLGRSCRHLLKFFDIPMRDNTAHNSYVPKSTRCREAISAKALERYANPEERQKASSQALKRIADGWIPDTRAANQRTRELWQDPKFKAAQIKRSRSHARPNKPETRLGLLLEIACPGEYGYTGNGSLVIGCLNPDFANQSKKKVVEAFGDYWHSPETVQCNGLKMEPGRIDEYSYLGWDCLVIWEHELKYSEEWLIRKIQSFNEREFTKKGRPEVVVLTLTKEEMSHPDFGIGREVLLNEGIELSGSLL